MSEAIPWRFKGQAPASGFYAAQLFGGAVAAGERRALEFRTGVKGAYVLSLEAHGESAQHRIPTPAGATLLTTDISTCLPANMTSTGAPDEVSLTTVVYGSVGSGSNPWGATNNARQIFTRNNVERLPLAFDGGANGILYCPPNSFLTIIREAVDGGSETYDFSFLEVAV